MRISEKKLKEIESRHFERKARGRSFDPDPEALSDFEELFKAIIEYQDADRDILIEMTARFVVAMMTSQGMPGVDVGDTAITRRAARLARDVFDQVDVRSDQ